MPASIDTADLFRHVSADKAAFYRCIMEVFAAAKLGFEQDSRRHRADVFLVRTGNRSADLCQIPR
jgi:hypothetical protein